MSVFVPASQMLHYENNCARPELKPLRGWPDHIGEMMGKAAFARWWNSLRLHLSLDRARYDSYRWLACRQTMTVGR
jgi:hypothetical protein